MQRVWAGTNMLAWRPRSRGRPSPAKGSRTLSRPRHVKSLGLLGDPPPVPTSQCPAPLSLRFRLLGVVDRAVVEASAGKEANVYTTGSGPGLLGARRTPVPGSATDSLGGQAAERREAQGTNCPAQASLAWRGTSSPGLSQGAQGRCQEVAMPTRQWPPTLTLVLPLPLGIRDSCPPAVPPAAVPAWLGKSGEPVALADGSWRHGGPR